MFGKKNKGAELELVELGYRTRKELLKSLGQEVKCPKIAYKVVRTTPNDYSELESYLSKGFWPVFSNKIGRDVEYVLKGFDKTEE